MSIEGLVDATVMEHLSLYGNIQRMDPFAIHLLKNSEHPLMRFRRTWMRAKALQQVREAEANQRRLNAEVASLPKRRGASMQKAASIDPYYAADMRRRHKAELNDKDFIGFVKREEPAIFPKPE